MFKVSKSKMQIKNKKNINKKKIIFQFKKKKNKLINLKVNQERIVPST